MVRRCFVRRVWHHAICANGREPNRPRRTGMNRGSFATRLADIARDARVATRGLSRDRTFTATALLTLVVCLAANAAIFSIVRSVVLKPLPFEQPDRLVLIANSYPKR